MFCQYDNPQSRLRLLARLIARHHLNVNSRGAEKPRQEKDPDLTMKEKKGKHGDEDLPGDT